MIVLLYLHMDLVMELDGFLDKEFCEEIVYRCKQDSHDKSNGLHIHRYNEWNEINDKLREVIKDGQSRYIEWLRVILPDIPNMITDTTNTEFKIENHDAGYNWVSLRGGSSLFNFFIHLTDVKEGGETEFVYKKVKPRTGKLVFFPAHWTSIHRGLPCENKYVLMGSFHTVL